MCFDLILLGLTGWKTSKDPFSTGKSLYDIKIQKTQNSVKKIDLFYVLGITFFFMHKAELVYKHYTWRM